jgi:hypothetical protein
VRSIRLVTEPNVRQTQTILARIERELGGRGARVARTGAGAVRFNMPWPWRLRRLDALSAISAGVVAVSAGAGEPRRVRYQLRYTLLLILAAVASLVLVGVGWGWSRVALLNSLLALWALLFGAPYLVADARFRRLLEGAARDVVERRTTTRETPVPGVPEVRSERSGPAPDAGRDARR